MITKNPMQLKAFIKNKAAEKHISAQLVMQNYMLERLLERISLSPYKNNFILKGGFLISAIVGLDTRATMDLDTTIKGFTLTHEAIRKIFTEICAVQIADDVLDYRGNAADTGKNLGADLREGKVTLPIIYARESCTPEERAMIDEAIRLGDGDFPTIAAIVLKSDALEKCRLRAEKELDRGRAALEKLSPSIFRDSLLELLAFTVQRDR